MKLPRVMLQENFIWVTGFHGEVGVYFQNLLFQVLREALERPFLLRLI